MTSKMAEAKSKRAAPDSDDTSASARVEAGGDSPVKRGRGRPRKIKPSVDESEPKIKRPRGRPKGSLKKAKKTTPPAAPKTAGTKKRRGRPRKQVVATGDDGDDDDDETS